MARTDTTAGDRGRNDLPRSSRYLVPRDTPHYGQLAAALAVAVLVVHLLLAQLTLLLAAGMYAAGTLTRWRPQWLVAPAGLGVIWTLAIGPSQAGSGLAAGPRLVLSYLGGIGGHPGHLLSPQGAFAGMQHWLPEQFPLALILAAAEAALLTWLWRRLRGGGEYRPGLIVAARGWLTTATLRSGGLVTRDGAMLGVDVYSGRPAAISWPEAEGGVLCAGADARGSAAQAQDGFSLAWAAIRRRKPVIVIDLTGAAALAQSLASACLEPGAPFSHFSDHGPGCYEPLRGGDPARAASLISAMIDWSGVTDQHRRSFSAYLTDALAVQAAVPGDLRLPVLDDLARLLTPDGLRERAALIPAYHPRREVLADRAAVSASLLQADPATAAAPAEQLDALRASALGRWLRTEPHGSGRTDPVRISLGQTVRERGVTLFSLDRAAHGSAARMIAGLAVADLMAVGAELEDMSVPGDGLAWVNGCEGLGRQAQEELIAQLIARGRAAGMAVVVSTTAASAGTLVAGAGVLVAHWPVDPDLVDRFGGTAASGSQAQGSGSVLQPGRTQGAAAGGILATLPDGRPLPGSGEFALVVARSGGAQARVLPHCRPVRDRAGERAADGRPAA
jgi:hypothetical protein